MILQTKKEHIVLPCILVMCILLAAISPSAGGNQAVRTDQVPVLTYRVVRSYPHDPGAFTQGLTVDQGELFEGTGRRERSFLRRVDRVTGAVLQQHALAGRFFGEGITIFGDRIIQLTWKAGIGFVYDKKSLALIRTFSYSGEGWGLTHDGASLIMSDGTPTLRFLDPRSFAEIHCIKVVDPSGPVAGLNELEYVEGKLYANVWQTDRIAVIDPESGRVTAWLDLAGLLDPIPPGKPVDVLNGIAYDAKARKLYVTGKLWPRLFEIEVLAAEK